MLTVIITTANGFMLFKGGKKSLFLFLTVKIEWNTSTLCDKMHFCCVTADSTHIYRWLL